VILDEMDIDGHPHHYRWQMVLPSDLHGQVTIDGTDAIITDPETGNFVLVRPVASSAGFTAKYEETEWARGVIAFETTCPSWEFAVMLMAFRKGEEVPAGTDVPRLEKTMKEMAGALVPDKRSVVRAIEDQRKKIERELDGFALEELGQPFAVVIPEGSVPRARGIVGEAYAFNGEESMTVPAGLPPFDDVTPFTVAFWARSRGGTPQGTLYNNNGNRGLCLAVFQGRALKVSVDGNWYWAKPRQMLEGWCHLVCTYDGSRLAFYQNGALVKDADRTGSMGPSRGGTVIGDAFKGWVDGLRVYPRALSADEVAKLHSYQRYLSQ
jgi:hypothetical protein